MEIPVSVPLLRVPSVHSALAEVIAALEQLADLEGDLTKTPYLEVRVLLEGPEPGLRHKIETVLTGKQARLAKIDVRYKTASPESGVPGSVSQVQLNDLQPLDVFTRTYCSKYNTPVPEALGKLFRQVLREVNESEAGL